MNLTQSTDVIIFLPDFFSFDLETNLEITKT